MAKHVNLFAYASGEKEVYAAFQRDFKRDDRIIQIANIVVIVGLLYLCRHLSGLEYLAALAVGGGALVHIGYMIDHSNRNFLMHLIDWQSAMDYQREQKAWDDKMREAVRAAQD